MFKYPDRRHFSGLSSEAGFNVDVTEKAYRLSHILSILTKDAELRLILILLNCEACCLLVDDI